MIVETVAEYFRSILRAECRVEVHLTARVEVVSNSVAVSVPWRRNWDGSHEFRVALKALLVGDVMSFCVPDGWE
jgi:hypothetical protein